jgi:predicted AlkP superfamily pyrophosphatase or phosphodiesterase
MINDAVLSRFAPFSPDRPDNGLLTPIYADYSFGNIPNTVHYLLTRERLGSILPEDCFGGSYPAPQKTVLFFIDAFGWKFWQEHHERLAPMRRVAEGGVLTPISALFPSTTAASVSTMNTGVLPAVHAVFEWNAYIPAYGETIQTLPFRPLGTDKRDGGLDRGFDPGAMLMVRETAHQRLAARGVRSIQLANFSYADGAFNRFTFAGAEVIKHFTLAESFVQLKEVLENVKGKAAIGHYWASIDAMAHLYGPGSPHHIAEISAYWQTFEAVLGGLSQPDTLFLFTADHGQIRGVAEDTLYINERWPDLADCLAVSPTGKTILPNGSPRDAFLHVRPERREEVLGALKERLADIADVLSVDEAIARQLFGPQGVCAELRARLGDVLILPYDGQFVWWRVPGVMEHRFNGNHGGLVAAELISAFGVTDAL